MTVEDVERDGGHQSVAHGVLLIEEAGVRAGFHVVPGAPLVDDQTDAAFRIVAAHDSEMVFNQFIHPQCVAQRRPVFGLLKTGGRAFVVPGERAGTGIIVQADGVGIFAGNRHDLVRPLIVVHIRAAGNLEDLVVAVVAHVGCVTAELIGVELRTHIAAAAPVLIADTEIGQLPGFLTAVPLSGFRHRGNAVEGHVLHPLAHFLNGAAADIAVDIWLTANLTAQLHELVRAEGVVLHHAAPMRVDHALSVFLGADAVLPVVLVGKAAARPAQHRYANVTQRLHNVRSHAVYVRNRAILSDKKAVIDAAAQMFGKMSVQIAVDFGSFSLCVYNQLRQ